MNHRRKQMGADDPKIHS